MHHLILKPCTIGATTIPGRADIMCMVGVLLRDLRLDLKIHWTLFCSN
jgi:hypothetical protein